MMDLKSLKDRIHVRDKLYKNIVDDADSFYQKNKRSNTAFQIEELTITHNSDEKKLFYLN